MAQQRIFVTGGAGYIGSHVAHALIDAGYDVVVYDNLSTGFHSLVPEQATFVQGDILDLHTLRDTIETHNLDAVMHFAAKSLVSESMQKPLEYIENNVTGTINLLHACQKANIKHLVLSSTAAVYGEPSAVPISESASLKPVNPYGVSKMMMEQAVKTSAPNMNLSYVILRYFNVAGADPKGRTGECLDAVSHLIHRAAKTACGDYSDIKIFGDDYPTPDGTCVRDYIHVSDLADTHIKALQYSINGGENITLNCGYNRGYSVADVLNTVAAVTGTPLNIVKAPRRDGDPAVLVADNGLLLKTLDWSPRHDNLHDIIRSAVKWEEMMKERNDL